MLYCIWLYYEDVIVTIHGNIILIFGIKTTDFNPNFNCFRQYLQNTGILFKISQKLKYFRFCEEK